MVGTRFQWTPGISRVRFEPVLCRRVVWKGTLWLGLMFGSLSGTDAAIETLLAHRDLDPASIVIYIDGTEQKSNLSAVDKAQESSNLLWTRDVVPAIGSVSKLRLPSTDSTLHIRAGFKQAIPIGSVLIASLPPVEVSLLKPSAPYPGKPTIEEQWLPGISERRDAISIWTFPPGTKTRGIRISFRGMSASMKPHLRIGGIYLLPGSFKNAAPDATIKARSHQELAGALINGNREPLRESWIGQSSTDHPESITLTWPSNKPLRGIGFIAPGFGEAVIEALCGPDSQNSQKTGSSSWQPVGHFTLDDSHVLPGQADGKGWKGLGRTELGWVDFGKTIQTQAIRLRILSPVKGKLLNHPIWKTLGAAKGNVWLADILALESCNITSPPSTPTQSQLPKSAQSLPSAALHPPIPLKFTLSKPGNVTLVVEDRDGKRIRNVIMDKPFPEGPNIAWWDGLDESGRVHEWKHGIYETRGKLIKAGDYYYRGLVHQPLKANYALTVYNEGCPPWETADFSGEWLANHTPPSSVLYVPNAPRLQNHTASPQILVGSWLTEGGSGLAWLDLQGKKLRGQHWLGGVWTGASCLARDVGDNPIDGIYAYTASVWERDLRLQALVTGTARNQAPADARFGTGEDIPVLKKPYRFPKKTYKTPPSVTVVEMFWDQHAKPRVTGLAAYNGFLVVSLPALNRLMVVDVRKHEIIHTINVDNPKGLAFRKDGSLLALSQNRLLLFPDFLRNDKPPKILIPELDDPQQLTLDHNANIYISEHGTSHQVRVFDSHGQFLHAVGAKGTPGTGPYDPHRMNHPKGISISKDSKRELLWVAEEDFQPKRISVWTLDGKLLKALYGPTLYGGGGYLDPKNRSFFYHEGMQFKLDWQTGKSEPVAIYHRITPNNRIFPAWRQAPETPFVVKNHRYLVNAYSAMPTNGVSIAGIWLLKNGKTNLVAIAGKANNFAPLYHPNFKKRIPGNADLNKTPLTFVWSDRDADQKLDPEEVQFRLGAAWGGVTVDSQLAFTFPDSSRLEAKGMTDTGIPLYDLGNAKPRFSPAYWQDNTGGGQILDMSEGWSIAIAGPIQGFRNGKTVWTYPNQWPSLHASHYSPIPTQRGQIIGATRLLGPPVRIGNAFEIWGINGNMGNAYLLTSDGLFVSTLFQDIRTAPAWPRQAKPGLSLNGVSLGDESFYNSLNQTENGEIYIQNENHLIHIDGLQTLRKLPRQKVTVTTQNLTQAQDYFIRTDALRQQQEGRKKISIPLHSPGLKVDGLLTDWNNADWAELDLKTTAALKVGNDGRLYGAFRTGHSKLLENRATNKTLIFKTGGALDLMIGADPKANPNRRSPARGDCRLIITMQGQKPLAILYRAVVEDQKRPIPFSGPARTVTFDRVDDLSQQVKLATGRTEIHEIHKGYFFGNANENYQGDCYEFSIPLSVLGINPQPGQAICGDIGILKGNGIKTTQRIYWQNKATGLISDISDEARLTPHLWGTWNFK